jgi:hypothetical protein
VAWASLAATLHTGGVPLLSLVTVELVGDRAQPFAPLAVPNIARSAYAASEAASSKAGMRPC